MYRVWKKVFARLPTVSWFGACEDFFPGAVYCISVCTLFPLIGSGLIISACEVPAGLLCSNKLI